MRLLKQLRAGSVYRVLVPITLSDSEEKYVNNNDRYIWYEIEIVE